MAADEIEVKFKKQPFNWKKFLPLSLMIAVIVLDQVTKFLIVKNIPYCGIGKEFFGDFFKIIHVTNPGVAFSIGHGWSAMLKGILFRALPLVVLVFVMIIYFKNNTFTTLQRWAIMGIAGGGFGNLIDRFFRPMGVVDFLDVKFYGIFGLERWPTFNVADSAVVVCGILLIASFISMSIKETKAKRNGGAEK